jgi:hypothetical protein
MVSHQLFSDAMFLVVCLLAPLQWRYRGFDLTTLHHSQASALRPETSLHGRVFWVDRPHSLLLYRCKCILHPWSIVFQFSCVLVPPSSLVQHHPLAFILTILEHLRPKPTFLSCRSRHFPDLHFLAPVRPCPRDLQCEIASLNHPHAHSRHRANGLSCLVSRQLFPHGHGRPSIWGAVCWKQDFGLDERLVEAAVGRRKCLFSQSIQIPKARAYIVYLNPSSLPVSISWTLQS